MPLEEAPYWTELYYRLVEHYFCSPHHIDCKSESSPEKSRTAGTETSWRSGKYDLTDSCGERKLARPERLELPTPRFEAWYSIQLSYGRAYWQTKFSIADECDREAPYQSTMVPSSSTA